MKFKKEKDEAQRVIAKSLKFDKNDFKKIILPNGTEKILSCVMAEKLIKHHGAKEVKNAEIEIVTRENVTVKPVK